MERQDTINARTFCIHHSIDLSFIESLHEFGLIKTITINDRIFLHDSELVEIEKLIHLHFELGINLEGIDAITHLLSRMKEMQGHINLLTNRLSSYK